MSSRYVEFSDLSNIKFHPDFTMVYILRAFFYLKKKKTKKKELVLKKKTEV